MSRSLEERRELGLATMRSYQGEEEADALVAGLQAMAGDFADLVVGGFADVYARPGLSRAERQLITIASLVTLGTEPQLAVHLRTALRVGVTAEQLHEALVQLSLYAGMPRALNAFGVLREVLYERPEEG